MLAVWKPTESPHDLHLSEIQCEHATSSAAISQRYQQGYQQTPCMGNAPTIWAETSTREYACFHRSSDFWDCERRSVAHQRAPLRFIGNGDISITPSGSFQGNFSCPFGLLCEQSHRHRHRLVKSKFLPFLGLPIQKSIGTIFVNIIGKSLVIATISWLGSFQLIPVIKRANKAFHLHSFN